MPSDYQKNLLVPLRGMDKQSQLDRKREETGNEPSHGESITVSNRLVIDELSELHSEIHMFNYKKNCSLLIFMRYRLGVRRSSYTVVKERMKMYVWVTPEKPSECRRQMTASVSPRGSERSGEEELRWSSSVWSRCIAKSTKVRC